MSDEGTIPARTHDSANTYDALPYPSWPYAYAHPGRLGAMAVLYGLTPAAVATAHILELGCASGGNLIPLAAQFPQAQFVGVDLAQRQIDDGQRRVAELGLNNITLYQADLAETAFAPGAFDYILCHGVFSWVPPSVQDAILRICTSSLTPAGLALITYNVLPGWHLRSAVRDICLHYAGTTGSPRERADRARRALIEIAELHSNAGHYGAILRSEARRLSELPTAYIMGEFLAPDNHAFHFADFATRAQAHGLDYLGEASLANVEPHAMSAEATDSNILIGVADRIAAQTQADLISGRRFRRSILIKHEQRAQMEIRLDSARLRELHFTSAIRVSATAPASPAITTFTDGKGRGFALKHGAAAAALRRLAASFPSSVSMPELLQAAGADGNTRDDQVGRALLRLLRTGRASMSTTPLVVPTAAVEYPCVWPLARIEARAGSARPPGPFVGDLRWARSRDDTEGGLLPRLVRIAGQTGGPGRIGTIRVRINDTLGGMQILSRVAAVVLAAFVSVGGLSACSEGSGSGSASGAVTTVTSSDAVQVLAEPSINVIDVRTPAEFSSGHLPGAVNIDVEGSSFDQKIAGLSKTATYFVYCHSGNRSGVATDAMAKLGFTSIYNLKGGIADWQANGGAVVTN